MAAMAPALTDAPAEAHHIRFKLAAPSSSLSPGSTENNGNTGNILVHGGGTGKRKVSAVDENSRDFCVGNQEQATQQSPALGKLQPLVASYLCSDVTPVPSTKESVKLQSVILKQSVLKTHGILPSSLFNGGDFLLRKRQTLELSEGQLKSLMSSGSNGGGQAVAALNGLAKKLAMSSAAGPVLTVNGSKASTGGDSQPLTPPPDNQAFVGGLSGHILLKGTFKQKHSLGVSHSVGGNGLQQQTVHLAVPDVPSNPLESPSSRLLLPVPDGQRASGSQQGSPVCSPASCPESPASTNTLGNLDAQVQERTFLNRSRQGEIEGRLRRLRKRLQVVQAKQVERHVQQQLSGFLDSARSLLPPATVTRKGETATWRAGPGRHSMSSSGGLGRFLRSGSVPTELERLFLSGTTNLHAAESAFDSDVTESSSGGDTDLEEDELARVDIEQRHIKIWKRAESRYSVERASIISHWNWLQAHISDLEYRIRQQTDVYRQIRSNKGSVDLGGVAPSASTVSGADIKAEPTSQDCQFNVAESGLWKSQNGRPVNGVLNRVTECNTKLQPSPLDSTCVAARTRPLLTCRRRRLVQPNAVPNLNGKVQRTSPVTCLCRVNPSSCVMCNGRPSTPREDPQYDQPSLERLSRLDPAVHPILSLPDDVCVSLRLQQVMKSHWQGKAPDRSKPPKKLSLKHKLSSKDKHKTANSLTANRLAHYKSRADKLQRRHHHLEGSGPVHSAIRLEGQGLCKAERFLQSVPSAGPYDRAYSRKRPREHVQDRSHDPTPKLFLDSGSPCLSLASMHSSLHSPSLTRQLSTSSESSMPMGFNSISFSNTPPIRRRRGESSFDINNIVIPMSVAATTRVEKLQYKEILTPSWREVDIFSQPMAEEENSTEIEDLSDAAFSQLHQPCQDQERSRWTWMALAPAKRRGSRSYKSMDGRTTPLLYGTNPPTPQPASPDPGHFPPLLHDYSHLASPISPPSPDATSNPHTPCSRDSHSRLLSSEDTRCSTPDFTFEERTVAPWEHRNFPLTEDPAPEPEVERGNEMRRPRERSVSGCPSTGYDTDSPMPCDDDALRHKGHAH